MSDDSEETPVAAPATKAARKKKSAPRKAAKPKAKRTAEQDSAPKEEPSATPVQESVQDAPKSPEPSRDDAVPKQQEIRSSADEDAPQVDSSFDEGAAPIPFFNEANAGDPPSSNNKKRRRRKKKSGQGSQQQGNHGGHSNQDDSRPERSEHHSPEPRTNLDSEAVERKAWKIFQAEVGEEGLALIDDHDAREISRRCFRLAEIFLDEAARRSR